MESQNSFSEKKMRFIKILWSRPPETDRDLNLKSIRKSRLYQKDCADSRLRNRLAMALRKICSN